MKTEKVSLNKCKTVLQRDGSIYTDEEVFQIRDFLYMLAELEYKVFLKRQSGKAIKEVNES